MAAALGKNPRLIRLPVGLLRLVGVLTGKSAAVNRLIGSLTIDTSHIQSCLGWKPPYSMKDGMRETAKWLA
jgi:UDP-glucose 4-epimerase